MGMFSHRNVIYMVGGKDLKTLDDSTSMFMFDLNKNSPPLEKSYAKFKPMMEPSVIPTKDKIYFLSVYDVFSFGHDREAFQFQSFNTTTNLFEPETLPPFKGGYRHYGLFLLRDYIYLFVNDYSLNAYAFNTKSKSSEWKESNSLVSEFVSKKIPAPSFHRGDVGLSDYEYGDDKTRILVALCNGIPTAYRVRLHEQRNGSFELKSYRHLEDSHIPDSVAELGYSTNGRTHLDYLGGGRFCMIFQSIFVNLLVYVFEIDFAIEHENQIPGAVPQKSSKILSSKKFNNGDGLEIYGEFCLVSPPPPGNPSTSIEEDREKDYHQAKKLRLAVTPLSIMQVCEETISPSCSPIQPTGLHQFQFKSMGESQYAYFCCSLGIFRVKIPNFDKAESEFQIGFVVEYTSKDIPLDMGMFSHRNIIYMFGGEDTKIDCQYSSCMFMFDLNKIETFPIKSDDCLEDPKVSCAHSLRMVSPHVIPAGDKIYFLSIYEYFGECPWELLFGFQSFDTTKNCLAEEPRPPFKGFEDQYGYFLLEGYIYLLVLARNEGYTFHVYTFNTKSLESEWVENGALAEEFLEKEIPAPSFHRGDIGLSDEEFGDDKTRILVALYVGKRPIAYRVRLLEEGGSFEPISYRLLEEGSVADPADKYIDTATGGKAHLCYLGGGRFCVIYRSLFVDLLMYVFKIDFALEHKIQISGNASTQKSCSVLSSKSFNIMEDMHLVTDVYIDFCFVSSPPPGIPSTSNEEDQEKKDYHQTKKHD